MNILDKKAIEEIVVNNNIDTLVHFSALLSAVGEQNVDLALQINCQGVQNVLEVARNYKLKIFIPSTIGVFGEATPRILTPDMTIQRPKTIYGVKINVLVKSHLFRLQKFLRNYLANTILINLMLIFAHFAFLVLFPIFNQVVERQVNCLINFYIYFFNFYLRLCNSNFL